MDERIIRETRKLRFGLHRMRPVRERMSTGNSCDQGTETCSGDV